MEINTFIKKSAFFALITIFASSAVSQDYLRLQHDSFTISTGGWGGPVTIPARVIDFNNLQSVNSALTCQTIEQGGIEYFGCIVSGGYLEVHIRPTSNHPNWNAGTDTAANTLSRLISNYNNVPILATMSYPLDSATPYMTVTYRGTSYPNDSIGEPVPFGKYDKVFREVKHFDLSGDGGVDLPELFEPSATVGNLTGITYWFADLDGDNLCDTGELFYDQAGNDPKAQQDENIPIRTSINDGLFTEEEEREDEDEETLEDILKNNDELNALKDKLGEFTLDDFSVTEKDWEFSIDMNQIKGNAPINANLPTLEFDGFDSYSGVAGTAVQTIRGIEKGLLLLLYIWIAIGDILRRLGEW